MVLRTKFGNIIILLFIFVTLGIFLNLFLSLNEIDEIIGECCMPGYEAEREKLRQYLGIEWEPNGLKAMDGLFFKLIFISTNY